MADMLYLQDDDGENADEVDGVQECGGLDQDQDGDSGTTHPNQDDFLPPLVRLEKYCNSDNHFHRQMLGRLVLETLRAVADSPEDVASVMAIASKLADDPEAPVRADLMEQVPHIAILCYENKEKLHHVVLDHLLPLVVKFLSDDDNQVRKTSQAALLVLMEQGLVEQSAVEEKVCPVILMLTEMDSLIEFHTGAVALMSKMAPLLGRKSTENLFLNRFATLCTYPAFYVRKVCATNFGEFCAVVGTESTESILLPRFVDLCEDEIWGVRKACAESFMSVSCTCSLQMRRDVLAPAFANLLVDQSRWVRMSAFQALGPFISTFADPSITGLSYNNAGELVLVNPEGLEFRLAISHINENEMNRGLPETSCFASGVCSGDSTINTSSDLANDANFNYNDVNCSSSGDMHGTMKESSYSANSHSCDSNDSSSTNIRNFNDISCASENSQKAVLSNKCDTSAMQKQNSEVPCEGKVNGTEKNDVVRNSDSDGGLLEVSEDKGQVRIHADNSFNAFQYWRVPIPDIELDISLAKTGKPTAVHVKAKVTDDVTHRTYASELNVSMDMELDNELDSLATRLEQCSLGSLEDNGDNSENKKLQQAQICTASVAVITDSDKKDAENSIKLRSSAGKAVMWFKPGGEITAEVQKSTFKLCRPEQESFESILAGEMMQQGEHTCVSNGSSRSVEMLQTKRPSNDTPCENTPSQEIVPQFLIDHFVSMTHPSQAQKTDNEIAHHCAFSLPAVALTLGRANWGMLREAYSALASDMQWKVRRTVASSIHQLAVILGEDIATKDLVPVFNGFIKDLDEVRIGALKHLAEFLRLLRPQERNSYLPRLTEFLLTDNDWNWRFREQLAEQLLAAVTLFTPENSRKHLTPIGITLLMDKVAAVRQVSLHLVTELVNHVAADPELLRGLLAELAEWFAHSKRWNRRQTFALLCSELIRKQILADAVFSRDILPHFLDLSWDTVPNVRLCVARTLSVDIMAREYYSSIESPHHEVLVQVLKRLQNDSDRDVKYFASLNHHQNTGTLPEELQEEADGGYS